MGVADSIRKADRRVADTEVAVRKAVADHRAADTGVADTGVADRKEVADHRAVDHTEAVCWADRSRFEPRLKHFRKTDKMLPAPLCFHHIYYKSLIIHLCIISMCNFICHTKHCFSQRIDRYGKL